MNTAVPIRILIFASLREQAGWSERSWWHPSADHDTDPMTPRRLWELLELPGNIEATRVAINHQFSACDTPIYPGDELAFLPPISGG